MDESRSLPALAVELGLAAPSAMEEVEARQLIFGGDFATNCLELGALSESVVLSLISNLANLPPRGEPIRAELTATKAVLGLGVLGYAYGEEDEVVVVVAERLAPETVHALEEKLDATVRVRLELGPRIDEVLAKLRERSLSPRVATLLTRIGVRRIAVVDRERAPESEARKPVASSPARPPAVEQERAAAREWEEPLRGLTPAAPPVAQLEEQPLSVDTGITAPPPEGYEHYAVTATRDASPRELAERRRRQQSFLRDVSRSLLAAKERDEVLEVLLDAASEFFEFTALFTVQSGEARLHAARGPGAADLPLTQIRIPLDLPSAYRKVVSSSVHQLARLRASGIEGGIVADLKRPRSLRALLLPIMIRGRTVLLLQGDQGSEDIDLSTVSSVIDLAPVAGQALERVLLERKRQSLVPSPIASGEALRDLRSPERTAPPPRTAEVPVRAEGAPTNVATPESDALPTHAQRLAPLASESERLPPPPENHVPTRRGVAAPETTTSVEPNREPPGAAGVESTSLLDVPNAVESPAPMALRSSPPPNASSAPTKPGDRAPSDRAPSDSSHEVVSAEPRALRSTSEFPPEHAKTLPGFPSKSRPYPGNAPTAALEGPEEALTPPEASARQLQTSDPKLVPRRIVPLDPHRLPTPPPTFAEAIAPPKVRRPPSGEIRPSGTLVSRRPLLNEPPEDGWSSPTASAPRSLGPRDYGAQVDALLAGDEKAFASLAAGGESAIGALVARFPGPVTEPKDGRTKASECGPVLRALVSHGSKAVPFITVRTADENPNVRRYATLLLGELPSRESARAVAERLADSALEVRRAALASARQLQSDTLSRRTLRADLEEIALDRKQTAEGRTASIEALADIREQEAIPTLLQLFSDPDRTVTRAAIWALGVLTRHDFGPDLAKWREFWQEHRDTPRVEWLILALGQENPDLRRAAAEELRGLSGLTLRVDEEASEADRRMAQAEARRWLETHRGQLPRR